MVYTAPKVCYSTTVNGTYSVLTGVQSIQVRRGRQKFQDPFPHTVCTVELIPATSYSTPLKVGQFIDVREENTANAGCWFSGIISDIERQYAVPYNSSTNYAPADRIIITALGATGFLGTAGNVNLNTTADARTLIKTIVDDPAVNVFMENLVATNPADVAYFNEFGVSTTINSSNSDGVLDTINNLLRSGQGMIDDVDRQRTAVGTQTLQIQTYKTTSAVAYSFTDGSVSGGQYKFTNIKYLSGAETRFSEVQVNGYDNSLTPQVASTGTAPHNSLTYSTALNSTTQMNSLANYVLTVNNETAPTPIMVSTTTIAAPNSVYLLSIMTKKNYDIPPHYEYCLGAVATIYFRGTTVTGLVQGITTNFYPDYASLDFYISPYLGIPFVLDSVYTGKLDEDRLGYP